VRIDAGKLRVLIVDDEPLARQLVASLLRADSAIEICGVASSGQQAIGAIQDLRPDVVFIDIRMPGLNGIGVIRSVGADNSPLFVIVTAFEAHALEAFEVRAFDYVLKPIDKARFRRAVSDVHAAFLNRRALAGMGTALARSVMEERVDSQDAKYLRLRAGERVLVARFEDVRYFEACNQYVRVHIGDTSYLLSTESLGSLQSQATPETFFRVHRSFLVNFKFVRSIVSDAGGGRSAMLGDGRRLPIARRNMDIAERLLIKLSERLPES
jgi:two-component system LytT family response regulator